jgi:hypothetical protein
VLQGYDETTSLAMSLSSATDLTEGHIDAEAANGVHWGGLVGADRHFVALPQVGA